VDLPCSPIQRGLTRAIRRLVQAACVDGPQAARAGADGDEPRLRAGLQQIAHGLEEHDGAEDVHLASREFRGELGFMERGGSVRRNGPGIRPRASRGAFPCNSRYLPVDIQEAVSKLHRKTKRQHRNLTCVGNHRINAAVRRLDLRRNSIVALLVPGDVLHNLHAPRVLPHQRLELGGAAGGIAHACVDDGRGVFGRDRVDDG
jgi:hypothetical protein